MKMIFQTRLEQLLKKLLFHWMWCRIHRQRYLHPQVAYVFLLLLQFHSPQWIEKKSEYNSELEVKMKIANIVS